MPFGLMKSVIETGTVQAPTGQQTAATVQIRDRN